MPDYNYPEPTARLLTLGEAPLLEDEWLDYPKTFGLSEADVPTLTQLMTDLQFEEYPDDEELGDELWAPIHAARALGQLRAEAAIPALLKVVELYDEDLQNDVPKALGMIGAAAIAPCVEFWRDPTKEDMARIVGPDAVSAIPTYHPEARADCIAALTTDLEKLDQWDEMMISALTDALVNLKAVEAASLIEKAFETEKIDEMWVGSWPQVQVNLGLKQESDFSPEELLPKLPPDMQEMRQLLQTLENLQRQNQKPEGFAPPSTSSKAKSKSNKTKKKKKKK